jgi:hypothetical protein
LDDNNGHHQTFTANKSSDEINDKVKWLFEKDLRFVPDTMRRRRITAYEWRSEPLALFVTELFKDDYPDLRALHVCSVYPFVRHYGCELKTVGNDIDPVCTQKYDHYIELFSLSLAKTVAGYYNFDYDNVAAVSSGGDVGYRGAINREKIATEAQKMSFLAGVFIRHQCFYSHSYLNPNPDPIESRRYSIPIPNSLSTLSECVDILKEFGCDIVNEIPGKPVVFDASDKVRDFLTLVHELSGKMFIVIAY